MAELDLTAIEASIAALTPEEIKKQLTDIRTRQKVNQKKYQNVETQKAYRQKAAAMNKLLVAKAKELGLYDEITAEAKRRADEQLAEKEVETLDDAAA